MSSSIYVQAYLDVKISLHLLKENWRAFIGTELFALTAFFLVGMISGISLVVLGVITLPHDMHGGFSFYRPFIFISVLIFFAFLACQFGLAFDIISSGDMFAEFRGSFVYFRKYWLQYPVLMIAYGLPSFFMMSQRGFIDDIISGNIFNLEIHIIGDLIIRPVITFIFLVLFIGTLPSLTSQGNFKKCFAENFRILFGHSKRLIVTWGLFVAVIYLPFVIMKLILLILSHFAIIDLIVILIPLEIISALFSLLIGTPIMALLATRIYTSEMINKDQTVHSDENNGDLKKNN